MNKLVAWAFLLLMIATSMQKMLIVGVYELSKSYIIEKYCVNKDKPELHCDGKCHLEKTIAKASKEKDTEKDILNRLTEEVIALYNFYDIHAVVVENPIRKYRYNEFKYSYCFTFQLHLLKPPQFFTT